MHFRSWADRGQSQQQKETVVDDKDVGKEQQEKEEGPANTISLDMYCVQNNTNFE